MFQQVYVQYALLAMYSMLSHSCTDWRILLDTKLVYALNINILFTLTFYIYIIAIICMHPTCLLKNYPFVLLAV